MGVVFWVQGGADDEASYDGRKLAWTKDARYALRAVEDAYLRRRTRAQSVANCRVPERPAIRARRVRA